MSAMLMGKMMCVSFTHVVKQAGRGSTVQGEAISRTGHRVIRNATRMYVNNVTSRGFAEVLARNGGEELID